MARIQVRLGRSRRTLGVEANSVAVLDIAADDLLTARRRHLKYILESAA